MHLRVLDDDRPGYAQLVFDGPLKQPKLALSVRSEREGAFLGADGNWQKAAHFFTAVRIAGDAHSSVFRVGPEIVNHLLEFDAVEFAADDGSFRVETTWENAVPQMPSKQKGGSIYREPVRAQDLAPIQNPPPLEKIATREVPEEPPLSPQDQRSLPTKITEPETTEPETAEADRQAAEVHRDPAEDVTPPTPKPPTPEPSPTRHRVLLLAAAGAAFLVLLAFGIFHFLPCDWFGASHCVLAGEVEAAQKARSCAASKTQSGRDCDITGVCVAPYLASFPTGQARGELEAKAQASDKICQQMVEQARGVHQCIDDLKAQNRSSCDVQAACTQTFQSLYPTGPLRSEIDDAAQQAEAQCQNERNNGSGEETALRTARQCAADAARKCAMPGCYAAYLNKYGLSGRRKNEAQSEAIKLDQACIEEEARQAAAQDEEAAALDAARECARGIQRCAAPRCYAEYLSKFVPSGQHGAEARKEADQLDSACNTANQQRDEDSVWQSAKRCAADASPCVIATCFAPYKAKFAASGAHRLEVEREISQAAQSCSATSSNPVADGRYSARSKAACGLKQDYFSVEVRGSQISWEHEFFGVKYSWQGDIDQAGNVSARVANYAGYTASGQLTQEGDKQILMKYPKCQSGVTFDITGKVQ